MPFDQSSITGVNRQRTGADLLISWTSTAPSGTPFQVYVGRRLTWHGTSRRCVIPIPPPRTQVDIGAVLPSEESTDLSATLASPGWSDRVALEWVGGSYESPTLQGFRIYSGATPGAAVDYTAPVGDVAAYAQGRVTDGYGFGPYGYGLYGQAAANYAWTSGPLAPGAWHFGVKPYDAAGVEGDTREVTVTVSGPPAPPSIGSDRLRIRVVSYDHTTRVATLGWGASPG